MACFGRVQQAASLRCADYADTQRGPKRGGDDNNEPGRENQCGTMSEERENTRIQIQSTKQQST